MNVLLVLPRVSVKFPSRTGVGTYVSGLSDMFRDMGVSVDVISENTPIKNRQFHKYISPIHFETEIVDNLRDQITDALFKKVYNLIECSTFEAILACVSLGIHRLLPVYYRTHNTSFVFGNLFDFKSNLLRGILHQEPLYLMASSDYTADLLRKDFNNRINVTGIPIPHLNEYSKSFVKTKQEGILCVSRFSDEKNVEDFASLIKTTKLPAKVLTSSPTAARRWTHLLKSTGVDFSVKYNLSGKEKFDFISSSKLTVSVSNVETLGLSIVESAPFCKVLIQKPPYPWFKNFEGLSLSRRLSVVDQDELADFALEEYSKQYRANAPELVKDYSEYVVNSWISLLTDNEKFPNSGKVGGSELSNILNSNSLLDWAEYAKDQHFRKLKQIYTYQNNHGLKTKGTLVRAK